MNEESLLNLLQQKLLAHPDYTQLAHKLKSDVQTHPTRDEQRTILSALRYSSLEHSCFLICEISFFQQVL